MDEPQGPPSLAQAKPSRGQPHGRGVPALPGNDQLHLHASTQPPESLGGPDERVRTVMENLGAIVWEADPSTLQLSFVSNSVEKILGYSADLWLRTPNFWADHLHPQDREWALAREREMVQGEKPLSVEYRMVGADGQFYWFRDFMQVVSGAADNAKVLRGIMVDITDHKRTEDALRRSEQFNREVIFNAREGVVVYDRELRHVVWNRFMTELTGLPPDQVLGKSAFDLFPHLREESVKFLLLRALGGETVESHDIPYRVEATGKSGWVSSTYSPHFGTRGEIVGVIAIVREITRRKAAETELADGLRFETLLADLSARFVNVPPERVDEEIVEGQRRVCACLELEVSTLWQPSSEAPNVVTLTHLYRPSTGPPLPDRLDAREHFPWCFQQFATGKTTTIAFSTLDSLPAEMACDGETWRRLGVKTALIIGLKVGGGQLMGAITFHSVKAERTWPETTIKRLELVAQMFSNALARQFAERALQESEARFRTLISDAPVAIGVARDGVTRYVNTEYVKLFGLESPEEAFGRPILDQIAPQSQNQIKENLRLRREGRPAPEEYETYGRRKDGSIFPVHVDVSQIDLADGPVTLRFLHDITERHALEEALRASEERHRRLFEVESDSILVLDAGTGRILNANQAALKTYGYSREEFLLLAAWDISAEPEKTVAAIAQMQAHVQLRWHRKKDGTLFPVEIASSHFIEQERRIQVAAIRDVTERVRAERELRRSFEQLRALAARMRQVREEERKRVAREIHDRPGQALTAIKLDLSALVREMGGDHGQPPERVAAIMNLLDETIQEMRRISTQLRPGVLDDLGLVPAIEWAGRDFERRTGTKCRLVLPNGEFPVDSERATAIFRILQETLTNVARHAAATVVEIGLKRKDNRLILSVGDDGRGMPQEEPSDRPSLGILGMQERAKEFGGEIKISSTRGKGTKVKVSIPEAPSHARSFWP